MSTKYIANGFRAVSAETMKEAAKIFANRQARRNFGKRGYARTCNIESWSQDNTLGEFNAFLGVDTGLHETTGWNFRFTVRRA